MRIWARAGAAVVGAAVAGVVSGLLLGVASPSGPTTPKPGPILETVTPAQLTAMNVRLEALVQPVELPAWLDTMGVHLPAGILLAGDAESSVRDGSGGVRDVIERVLTRATVLGRSTRMRGPTIVRRMVWAVVGTRDAPGGSGGITQFLWLVDAHTGRELAELPVPAPPGGVAGSGP